MKRSLALWVALTFSVPAFAEKIAIGSFGAGGDSARNQLTQALCDAAECVNASKVMKGAKPDLKKVKKEKVDFIVTGKVGGKGKKKTLDLQVLNNKGTPKWKKSFPLDGTTLGKKQLALASAGLSKAMGLAEGGGKSEPEPVAQAEEPRTTKPEPKPEPPPLRETPVEEVEPAPKPRPELSRPEPKEEEPDVVPAEEPKPKKKGRHPVLAIQVGVDGFNRSLKYTQLMSPVLRDYTAAVAFAPAAYVELYPLALVQQGLLAGLGLDASFSMVVGLRSQLKPADCVAPCAAGPVYGTNSTKLDFALKFRIPFGDSGIAVAPHAGFRTHSFSVGKGSDGTTLSGMPGINYSAIKLGLVADGTFGNFLVFLNFSYLPVLSSGEIISATYFPAGSASGLEGGGGIGLKMPFLEALQVRAAFNFTRYGLSFKPSGTYNATGATDQYIGGNLSLRYTF